MRLDMRKWNAVRPLIRARLLSEGQHDLSNIVKKKIGADIYLTFYIALPSPEGEVVAWEVSPPFLDYWKGVDVDTLECVAKENMAGRTTLTKLSDMLKAYIKTADENDAAVYIISTKNAMYGASAILSEEVQARLDDLFPHGSILLPSSLHEMLVLNAEGADVKALKKMVHDINRSGVVSEEDVLSDFLLMYENGEIKSV